MSLRRAMRAVPVLLLVAWLIVLWFGVGARVAMAESRHTAIALVSGGADAELHARLRAELAGLGWRVKEMALGADLALAQVARRAGTLAVLRVGRSAEGIEVWVAPEVDSEARSEWIDVDARRPELAVLRAVEALRARFLELGIEPEATREPASSTGGAAGTAAPSGAGSGTEKRGTGSKPDPSKPAASNGTNEPDTSEPDFDSSLPPIEFPELPRAPEALWLAANAGIVSASKELGPSASLSGAVRFVHQSWLGVDLSVWWPPSAVRVTGSEGFADVRVGLLALGGEVRDRRRAWTLAAGGGMALAWLTSSGYAEKDRLIGRSSDALIAMPFARAAAELELAHRLHLRVEGTLGFTLQNARVGFDQTAVASWGRPFLAGTLGLEWAVLGD